MGKYEKDSVFNVYPAEHYKWRSFQEKSLKIKILLATLLIYGVALFSLVWFLWVPASQIKSEVDFAHSPSLFFIVMWLLISFISILLCFYFMLLTSSRNNIIRMEVTHLAREVDHLEDTFIHEERDVRRY